MASKFFLNPQPIHEWAFGFSMSGYALASLLASCIANFNPKGKRNQIDAMLAGKRPISRRALEKFAAVTGLDVTKISFTVDN